MGAAVDDASLEPAEKQLKGLRIKLHIVHRRETVPQQRPLPQRAVAAPLRTDLCRVKGKYSSVCSFVLFLHCLC